MSSNFVNRGFVNKFFSIFPLLEIAIRIIYWKNIFFFKRLLTPRPNDIFFQRTKFSSLRSYECVTMISGEKTGHLDVLRINASSVSFIKFPQNNIPIQMKLKYYLEKAQRLFPINRSFLMMKNCILFRNSENQSLRIIREITIW